MEPLLQGLGDRTSYTGGGVYGCHIQEYDVGVLVETVGGDESLLFVLNCGNMYFNEAQDDYGNYVGLSESYWQSWNDHLHKIRIDSWPRRNIKFQMPEL